MALQVLDGPTIQKGESLSDGIDCSAGTIMRITVPQEFTDANLTFQASSDGNLYNDLYDDRGVEITVPVAPNTTVVISGTWARTVGFLKLRSGTRAAPVPQSVTTKFAIAVEASSIA